MTFNFSAGRSSLNFVATRHGTDPYLLERWVGVADLSDWIRQSTLIDDPGPLDVPDLVRARSVRHLLTELLRFATGDGLPLDDAARARLNDLAGLPRLKFQVGADGQVARTGSLDALLAEITSDALDLVSNPVTLARVGWCAAPECRLPFLDRAGAGRRRWCSTTCRTRHNSSSYRFRREFRRRSGQPDQPAASTDATPALASASAFSLPGSPA